MTSWDVSAWDVRLRSVGPSWGNCPSPSELLWLGLSADPSENLQKITWHILRWSRKKTQKAPLGVDGGFFCIECFTQSLTWNLEMAPWKRRFLLDTIIFRFHVKLGEGI